MPLDRTRGGVPILRTLSDNVVVMFVRYESPVPNRRGGRTGIFGLANGLAHAGQLSQNDWSWWRTNNDWFDAAYIDPATVDATLFDRSIHPVVSCWFRGAATHLLDRVPGYLALLHRYGVAWVERMCEQPGRVLYNDDVQIVVAPLG